MRREDFFEALEHRAGIPVSTSVEKAALRRRLQAEVAAFIAAGGQIECAPRGQSGEPQVRPARVVQPPTRLYTRADVAAALSVKRVTVSRWVKLGRFPPPTVCGLRNRWLWHESAVRAWLQKCTL